LIRVAGREVHRGAESLVSPEDRNVGMVFQDFALFPSMTVAENIAFGIHRDPDRQGRVEELLEWVGLQGFGERKPATLSGGQQQRVALARALAPRPALMLLDEPFANLDARLRRDVRRQVVEILRREETAALLVTHDREEALGCADRVAVLHAQGDGPATLAQIASPQELYRSPASVDVARMTGRVNVLEAMAEGDNAETTLGTVRLSRSVTGRCHLLLRPHELSFSNDESGSAKVERLVFQGATTEAIVRVGQERFTVDIPSGEAPEINAVGALQVLRPVWPIPG
jgi:iron(III) transport system ATP-binding protein